MDTIELSDAVFNGLLEYSCSLPTGQTIGKQWKCKVDYYDEAKGWLLCEYVEHENPDLIGINRKRIILNSDMPLLWEGLD
jgi:hypothetical protein